MIQLAKCIPAVCLLFVSVQVFAQQPVLIVNFNNKSDNDIQVNSVEVQSGSPGEVIIKKGDTIPKGGSKTAQLVVGDNSAKRSMVILLSPNDCEILVSQPQPGVQPVVNVSNTCKLSSKENWIADQQQLDINL
jgi:hypothetical protein